MTTRRVRQEAVRTILGSAVTAAYQVLGPTTANPLVLLIIKNGTDETVFISEDGSTDHYELPAGTIDTYDLGANAKAGNLVQKAVGVQFSVKGVGGSLPTTGNVIIQGTFVL